MEWTCARARELLWPLDRPRRHGLEEEQARGHVAGCPACRAFFIRDAGVARLLRDLGDGLEVSTPSTLRSSIAMALAHPGTSSARPVVVEIPRREPRTWGSGRGAQIAAAAAAALLLAAGQVISSRYGDRADTARFAADFLRTAAVEVEPPGLDVRRVGAFYERELGRHIEPVALHQAPVTRATVCDLSGDLGSMVEYDLAGTRLVHYRIPLDRDRASSADPSAPVAVDSAHGVQVAHWADADFQHALVSTASADYLAWLAEHRFRQPPGVTNYGSPASRSWRQADGD